MSDTIRPDSPLTSLKGVGEKTAELFRQKGIESIGDLLEYYPYDYDYYAEKVPVSSLTDGGIQAVRLVIIGNGSTVRAGGYRITSFHAGDETGNLRIVFYNMPYLVRTLRAGSVHVFRGRVKRLQNGNIRLEQPTVYSLSEYDTFSGTLRPRYHLTKGLKNAQVERLVRKALEVCRLPQDYIPAEDREKLGLMEREAAVRSMHFPGSEEEAGAARDRLVFDEFLSFILGIRRERAASSAAVNSRPMLPAAEPERLIERLPYRLTASQEKAWREIREDLTGETVMNRLLQGDVGSGKTILAFLALLLCAVNGRQGLFMAPTEVLAEQHMRDLTGLVETYRLPIRPVLLTGAVTGKDRTAAYEAAASGEANVLIGTHALIQEHFVCRDVGLVITDEQHRFGVRQREALAGKGDQVPVLVMSATPIPRTLSIILYGDLQVSRLTELPADRLPIRNLAASAADRGKMYAFILRQIEQGRQAYVICPAVEESEAEGFEKLQNVKDYTEKLRASLPGTVRIEALNGRMKPREKNRVLSSFERGDIDILVSTTVIEVGINVPNATCMLIENAERFGLSQLHQIRGRVGRGRWQSYCMFLYSEDLQEKPERLSILEKTNDGFRIAEEDLRLRGPGDLFGTRQSGAFGFRLADIYEDAGLLSKASDYADTVLARGGAENPVLSRIRNVDFRTI